MMSHIDLCSGVGGFALGFEQAQLSTPVLFCDIDPWSRKVLRKHWPDVPIAEDVKELASDPDGLIPDTDPRRTILTAGYPCSPFSVAGKQRGEEDDRHIWPEIFKIIQAKRPTWIVCENVVGHINLGLNKVLSDLESKANYRVQTFCIGAVSVDAPHRRQRIWIVAHANSQGEPISTIDEQWVVAYTDNRHRSRKVKRVLGKSERKAPNRFTRSSENVAHTRREHGGQGNATELDKEQTEWASRTVHAESSCARQSNVADTTSKGLEGSKRQKYEGSGERFAASNKDVAYTSAGRCAFQKAEIPTRGNGAKHQSWWATEPSVGRVAHGIPRRVDRLRGLGNAIVPQIAQKIGETIKAVTP
jgi:DNA (cytosine-5)-methyltransferase 1